MRNVFVLMVCCFLFTSLSAQDEGSFTRNGRWMIESGSNFFTGFSSSTGGNIFFDEGITITQLGIDMGKFVSENLAIKFRGGFFDIEGESLINVSAAGKYYLGGKAPLEVGGGFLFSDGDSQFLLDAHIGFAAVLASNVYFEPKAGIIYANSDVAGSVKFGFVMIL